MVDPSQSRFWRQALQTDLVNAAQMQRCWDALPEERRTEDAIDRRLAKKVVEMGLFTQWQAQQLLLGIKPQSLHLDRYVIEDLIGLGGMGRVYRARDTRLDRCVALKVLSRERMTNERAITRFKREAKVGASLQHEHLVRIYDQGQVNGAIYIVMELIHGKNVGQLIVEHGLLPPGVACRIAHQVALGLDHAAHKGLVHRDVNPMNILIDEEGDAKLTDLGLAINLDEPGDAVTREGATVGTFDYISPEQARHSRQIDSRSDIYSLGCSLYHMITGRVPFPQPSLPEKLYAHQMLEPEPLRVLVHDLPAGLDEVIGRMLAKKPEDRYASCGEVAVALAAYEQGPITLRQIEELPEVPIWLDDPDEQVITVPETTPPLDHGLDALNLPITLGGLDPYQSPPGSWSLQAIESREAQRWPFWMWCTMGAGLVFLIFVSYLLLR